MGPDKAFGMFPEGDGVSEQEVKQRPKEEERREGGEEGMVHLVWTRHLDRAGMGRDGEGCVGAVEIRPQAESK